jgi:hypothetical protein
VQGWASSTVRAVLQRETYRGVVVWNKTRKRNAWGKQAPTDRPESEWLRVEVPHLRIIPEDLWQRVAARRREVEGRPCASPVVASPAVPRSMRLETCWPDWRPVEGAAAG